MNEATALREELASFKEWKARVNKGIPSLAMKIFALRIANKPQRRLELLLARVMEELSDVERMGKPRHTLDSVTTDRIIMELNLEELYKAVK